MAITSIFFLGTKADAEANEATERRAEFFRVMNTNVAAIYELATQSKCPSFELVGNSEDYSVVTQRVPIELVTILKTLQGDAFEETLKKWMSHEEAPYDNENDHRELLDSLVELSKSVEGERNLYLQIAM